MPRLTSRILAPALLAAGLVLPAPRVAADPPAAIAPAGKAHTSFEQFARSWMGKLQKAASKRSNGLSYKGFDGDFKIELRPTGHAAAPYVGILRYQERTYRCTDSSATTCVIAAVTPVTEIFRFQGGRWIY